MPFSDAARGIRINTKRRSASELEREPIPDSAFDARYPEDLASVERHAAWAAKPTTWDAEALSQGQAAIDAGDDEERPIPLDKAGEALSSFAGLSTETPHTVVRTGGDLPPPYARVACLRYDDHPWLHDGRDELNYLQRRLARAWRNE